MRQRDNDSGLPPLLVSLETARGMLNIGRTTLYELIKAGDIVQVRIGRRTLITTASLHHYVRRLEQA